MRRGLKANLTLELGLRGHDPDLLRGNALMQWSPQDWLVAADWRGVVDEFFKGADGLAAGRFIKSRLDQGAQIYPSEPLRALALTPMAKVSVVILGQDPYHGPGQAEGLSFSVPPGVKVPPSLRNIHKELQRDPELAQTVSDGSLVRWAEQGVLLLNTCLTVESGQPASHSKAGWQVLTDEIVKTIWEQDRPTVFMLWGAHAQAKRAFMTERPTHAPAHLVLCANHPSPLSALRPPAPFIGCGHFSQANEFLRQQGRPTILW